MLTHPPSPQTNCLNQNAHTVRAQSSSGSRTSPTYLLPRRVPGLDCHIQIATRLGKSRVLGMPPLFPLLFHRSLAINSPSGGEGSGEQPSGERNLLLLSSHPLHPHIGQRGPEARRQRLADPQTLRLPHPSSPGSQHWAGWRCLPPSRVRRGETAWRRLGQAGSAPQGPLTSMIILQLVRSISTVVLLHRRTICGCCSWAISWFR